MARVGGPTLCAMWAVNFSFISAKTYNLGVKNNSLNERVLLSNQVVFTQPENYILGIQKNCFDETVLLSTQNTCSCNSSFIEIVIFSVFTYCGQEKTKDERRSK